eukprot:scaffold86123_cov32-Tisochrysis_lutea.AAC.4
MTCVTSGLVRLKPRLHRSASTALSSSRIICGKLLKMDAPRASGRARLCSVHRKVGFWCPAGTLQNPHFSSSGSSLRRMGWAISQGMQEATLCLLSLHPSFPPSLVPIPSAMHPPTTHLLFTKAIWARSR